MSKFKVGDRVRSDEYDLEAGTVIAVIPQGEVFAGQFRVRADDDGSIGIYEHDKIELIEPTSDPVNSPAHYASGEIECIDAIKAQMSADQFKGYLRGNIAKYVWRYEAKGGAESLEKARWYLDRLIAEVRAND